MRLRIQKNRETGRWEILLVRPDLIMPIYSGPSWRYCVVDLPIAWRVASLAVPSMAFDPSGLGLSTGSWGNPG